MINLIAFVCVSILLIGGSLLYLRHRKNSREIYPDALQADKTQSKQTLSDPQAEDNAVGKTIANGKPDIDSIRKEAEKGDAFKQYALGYAYLDGQGVSQDHTEAVKWFRKSAEQGNDQSENNLGAMFSTGRGVAKDQVEAVKWFRLVADQGFAPAQTILGSLYLEGERVTQDFEEGRRWLNLAAEQGHAEAQQVLSR